jgi:hypothetical protein
MDAWGKRIGEARDMVFPADSGQRSHDGGTAGGLGFSRKTEREEI